MFINLSGMNHLNLFIPSELRSSFFGQHLLFFFRFLPLHWAVARDNPSLMVVSILLAAYPEGVNARYNEGFKPLDR
jgi:hypothetical protein